MKDYRKISAQVRLSILDLIYRTKSPHIGSSFSCVEILVALYFKCLRVSPQTANDPDRDRFIFSKGHACPALYAVLSEAGFLKPADLEGFAVDGGCLEQHPNCDRGRGIELSTGSLGHGLSVAAGIAYALKKDQNPGRVFCLLSDGELNEGSTWEAAMFASQHNLDNLIAILDYNKMQALGFTRDTINLEPLAERWGSFGWEVREADGHDPDRICAALSQLPLQAGKPGMLIAHTIKGKGVSFMENQLLWHYRCPDQAEYQKAREELF